MRCVLCVWCCLTELVSSHDCSRLTNNRHGVLAHSWGVSTKNPRLAGRGGGVSLWESFVTSTGGFRCTRTRSAAVLIELSISFLGHFSLSLPYTHSLTNTHRSLLSLSVKDSVFFHIKYIFTSHAGEIEIGGLYYTYLLSVLLGL